MLTLSLCFCLTLPFVFCDLKEPIGPLHCKLAWQDLTVGDQIPGKAIAVQTSKRYLAKSKNSPGWYGKVEVEDGTAITATVFQPNGNDAPKEVGVFQVLTNPHGCITQWVEQTDEDVEFAFKTEPNNRMIARAYEDQQLSPGFPLGNSDNMQYLDDDGSLSTTRSYSVLISYSKGLKLKLTDFIFENELNMGTDFVGMDEIQNAADVDVSQTVTHSTTVTESFSFTEFEETTTTWSISVDVELEVGLKGVGVGVGVGFTYTQSQTEGWSATIITSKTREISISRTVTVPPRTAVQVCTTLRSADTSNITYTATGYYTAPTLSGEEIVQLLATEGIPSTPEKDRAVIETKGSFSGSLFLNNQFIVHPVNAPRNCEHIGKDVVEKKRQKMLSKINKTY